MVVCADMLLAETAANDRDGKRVTITVYQGSNPDPSRPGVEVEPLIVSSSSLMWPSIRQKLPGYCAALLWGSAEPNRVKWCQKVEMKSLDREEINYCAASSQTSQ